MTFTAHNVRLQDGSETFPEAGYLIANSQWALGALRTLRLFYGEHLIGRSIIDLGCCEGGFTVEFARAGMAATGIEVRSSNFENCLTVKRGTGLQNLDFVKDDIWNISKYGPYDAAFCCVILYHLDRPAEFLRVLSNRVRNVIILHTHFATGNNETMYNLSQMTENEGLPGRWYEEHNLDDRAGLEQLKWASWNNKRSFWPTKPALLQILRDCGFDIVYEQYDFLGDQIREEIERGYYAQHARSMFVGVRASRT